jgi:glycosyltransferase involved in cell wall biosynthesis
VSGAGLRIGVDARELLGDATGVGRYLGELLRRWTGVAGAKSPGLRTANPRSSTYGGVALAEGPGLPARDAGPSTYVGRGFQPRRFLLYAPEALPPWLPATVEPRIGGRGRGTYWEQTWLRKAVRDDPPDVFFAPAYTAPLGIAVPLAVTIHDVSFAAHPEWYRVREGARRRFLTRRAADAARVIFTDSEFSRREIEQHLGAPRSRIRVIPPGLTPRAAAPADGEREPLVLFVGSLFNRRRLPHLIDAFARATREVPQARLAIVGDDRTWPPENLRTIAAWHGVEGRTDFRSYVPDQELAALYAKASVFAFLSEYEGFGLTPLEALAAGVPPVVLDTPVAREVYGDAAVYVGRDDVRGAADAIRILLTSADARARVLSAAPAVLSRYSWDTAAAATLDEIERIASA